jgi:hypothetical protein
MRSVEVVLPSGGSRTTGQTRLWGALAVLVSTLGVTGCSDLRAADLCTTYDQVSQRAEDIRSLDPKTTSVDDLRSDLDEFQASLDQLQATADGRLDTVISDLRSAVQDTVASAVDAGKKAVDTAEPLVEDSLSDVDQRWAMVKQRADDECDAS